MDEIQNLGEGLKDIVFSEDKDKYNYHDDDDSLQEYTIRRYRVLTKSGEVRWVLDYFTHIDSSKYKPLVLWLYAGYHFNKRIWKPSY